MVKKKQINKMHIFCQNFNIPMVNIFLNTFSKFLCRLPWKLLANQTLLFYTSDNINSLFVVVFFNKDTTIIDH